MGFSKASAVDAKSLAVLFSYDAETGVIRWRNKFGNRETFKALDRGGYTHGTALGATLSGHRVAWALAYGDWPSGHIDHINGDRADNRLRNLRDVSRAENARNRASRSDSRSGLSGVRFCAQKRKWQAYICINKRNQHLGFFLEKHEAVAARSAAQANLPFSSRHGASDGRL